MERRTERKRVTERQEREGEKGDEEHEERVEWERRRGKEWER